ncbi:histidine phosphatase family protein [Psychromonas sp. RZ22]|uniref:histidine phosphatase family protein n=1 Tax=Psychromonas algarum TaxID=2555643 RepID=UPI0010678FC2|nr:histidine phosphatase family protein [Psychromonas sp. RZ22]TEW56522.1 histidine phosphatase family protein [Psychromonas sp. RZ22]
MNKKTIFYLARHGQTEWNVEHRIQGQLDSVLTAQGIKQALHLSFLCKTLNISQILTSSLGRAIQTATICGEQLQLTPRVVAGFEERHFGVWQGKLTQQMQSHPDYTEITSQITDCKPEQGESAKQLLTRFENALKNELKTKPNETLLIIIHGDILRCFMAKLVQSKQSQTGYDYKNGQLNTISYDQETGVFTSL